MKKHLLYSLFQLTFLLSITAQGDLQWLQQISDVDDDIDIHQMNIDPAGNIYVGGSFDEQVGSGSPSQPKFSGSSESSLNEQNGFLAKYNSSGVRQWINKFGSPNSSSGYSPLAMVEKSGFLYVVGSYRFLSAPGLDFDPGAGITSYTSGGSSTDFFVSKYNTTTGSMIWAYVGGGSSSTDLPRGIAVDNSGNIYVSGYVSNGSSDVDFDIKAGVAANATGISGVKHLYIVKYDTDCNFLWRNNILNSSDNSGGSLTYDGVNDFIYMTGGVGEDSGGDPKFPSVGGGLATLNVNAADDGYIAKYNTSGVLQWVKNVAEGTSSNYFWSIDTDNTGNIYVGGVLQGTADFNPSGTRSLSSAGSVDASFAKYDALGNHQWSYRMGSSSFGEQCNDIRVTAAGNVVISGGMYGAADYNPEGTGGTQIKGASSNRYIFIGEYDTDFKYQWAHAIGGASTGNNNANAAAIDENDPLQPFYVWGYMGQGTTEDFDPNNAGGSYTATGTDDNGFLAKYSTNMVLPIELLSFNVNCIDGIAVCEWITETEINNNFFSIERSTDGVDFEEVGTVKGSGNSNSYQSYQFVDDIQSSDIIYYRLKQTDYNGEYEYFKIDAVSCKSENEVSLYPNPFNSYLNLVLEEESTTEYRVEIKNYLGQIVLEKFIPKGSTVVKIDINSELSKGAYFLQLLNNNEVKLTRKLIKL